MIQLTASAFRGVRNGSEREGAAHPRSPPLCLGRQASSQTAPRILLRDSHPRAPPAPPRARPSRPNRGAPGRVTLGRTPSERPPQASPSYRRKMLSSGMGQRGPHSLTLLSSVLPPFQPVPVPELFLLLLYQDCSAGRCDSLPGPARASI